MKAPYTRGAVALRLMCITKRENSWGPVKFQPAVRRDFRKMVR